MRNIYSKIERLGMGRWNTYHMFDKYIRLSRLQLLKDISY